MALPKLSEKRQAERFEIDCAVTVAILSPRNGEGMKRGRLRNIAVRGARFHLGHPLVVGARILLHVHFSHSSERVTTVRFEGIVMRVHHQPPYEIAVQFRRGGRFLRGKLSELFGAQ
jgi:hypothetical protein